MEPVAYGRKRFSFAEGKTIHTGTSITVKALPGENEQAFTKRLMKKYGDARGTVEIIFKGGRPDYAIISFSNF